ncbi:MAG: aminotransferase class V-fold PLP-dependent enzyme [Candidatus Acidiferrales bacterium]
MPAADMSAATTIENARAQFPALRDTTFLDAACVSIAPQCAIDAVREFFEFALRHPSRSATDQHICMDGARAAARPEVARLLNAGEDEIALAESTTHALNIAAHAIPLESGDRVLVCDLEFMQVAIPWLQLPGIAVDSVPHRRGAIALEDIAARIAPRTRVLAISSVQWSSGYCVDLAALGALCRERNVWLVVDAIQQLGAVPIDVRATPIDFLACGGHKWLNAPFGCGFLYVRRNVLPRLRPPIAGYLSLATPEGGWGHYFQTPSITPVRDYKFVAEARRYEIGGTANYPGAIALAASLQLISSVGQPRIAEHIHSLTDRLIAGLRALNLETVTDFNRENRAGIVTFSAGSPQQNLALMELLLERRILVSVRYTSGVGGIRVSCHFFNSLGDIDRLLSALASLR